MESKANSSECNGVRTLMFPAVGLETAGRCYKKELQQRDGIVALDINYSKEMITITYDCRIISLTEISDFFQEKGYNTQIDHITTQLAITPLHNQLLSFHDLIHCIEEDQMNKHFTIFFDRTFRRSKSFESFLSYFSLASA